MLLGSEILKPPGLVFLRPASHIEESNEQETVRMDERFRARHARKRARYLTQRIISLLLNNNEGFRIRFARLMGNKRLCRKYEVDPAVCGLVYWKENLIIVDFKEDNPLSTIIHEILHILYPRTSEKKVQNMEVLVMEYLTEYQAIRIWTLSGLWMRNTT